MTRAKTPSSARERIGLVTKFVFEPFAALADSISMTTLTDFNPPRAIAQSQTGYFYFYMALACTAVAFLGFAPTYWLPLAKRSFSASPVVHFHGLLFFAWS